MHLCADGWLLRQLAEEQHEHYWVYRRWGGMVWGMGVLGRVVVDGFLRRCCELGDVKTVGEISFKKLTQVASCLRLTAPDNQQNISAALVKGEHNGRWCSSTANISFVAESWHRLTIKKKMLLYLQ